MSTRYVSVDCGKADTKSCVRVNSDGSISSSSFPTRVTERSDRECIESLSGVSNTGFITEYDGKIYAVGDIATSDDSFTSNQNSKNDMIHKIATLTAIARVVNNDDCVNVVIGCPIELFSSAPNRDKYLNNILPSGRIDISVNGVSKHFSIGKKEVLPESMGILYIRPESFIDSLVGIIDIGGLNVNAALIDDLNLVSGSSFTEKLGRRAIENEIRRYANDMYESSFSATEINSFLKKGYIKDTCDPAMEERSRKFINDTLDDHLVKIVKTCVSHGWNLRNMDLVFIGGGSILLKEKISQVFPQALVVDNANFSNAEGFLVQLCQKERVIIHIRE